MSIRYDRNTRRATNGPLIFFSDSSAEINLSDEIQGAIDYRLCFYAYRRPGDMMISFGSSETFVSGIGEPGFVIAPFDPAGTPVTIPYSGSNKTVADESSLFLFPEKSTTKEEYFNEISNIKNSLEKTGNGKVVAARVAVKEKSVDVGATFSELCKKYPDAFVFAFSTPLTGCWIGATPELLLRSGNGYCESMALAGTRPKDSSEEWDIKNIEEQQIVTDYISGIFKAHGFGVDCGNTFSKNAGKIQHLCTPIFATRQNGIDNETIVRLIKDLSPTPAVCGFPKDKALNVISLSEQFRRGCYGGFCGPYKSCSEFSLYVSLRCMLVEAERFCAFAGGGITLKSIPESEWIETEMKAETIQSAIKVK